MATIPSIINSQFRCDICNLNLCGINDLNAHLAGQKHKKKENLLNQQQKEEEKANRGLFVSGFYLPPNQALLIKYFSKFGKLVVAHFGYDYLLLEYTDSKIARNVLNKSHILQGKQLYVTKRKIRTFSETKIANIPEKEEPDVLAAIEGIKELDRQIETLVQVLQPEVASDLAKYNRICKDLRAALRFRFPTCEIHPFGSTISGLSFNKSDVDVHLARIKLHWEDDVKCLYQARNSLTRSGNFANCLVIPQAKIPILKCVHVQTGISIDLNCKNMLGVCNSQLIRYYLSLDETKIKPLVMVVKYWGRIHKLTGSNHLMSNYSLCLLVLFYLQQPPYSLPSVAHLQRDPIVPNIQDGWNGAFRQMPYRNNALKEATFLQLLSGFFDFYANFPYSSHIICPFLGEKIDRSEFMGLETVPDIYCAYKTVVTRNIGTHLKCETAICLQDPFEHNRNTTVVITPVTLGMFVTFCTLGKQLCSEKHDNLLHKLLTETPECLKYLYKSDEPAEFSIHQGAKLPHLQAMEKDSEEDQEKINEAWFDSVLAFIKMAIKDFLMMSFEEIEESATSSKQMKKEGQSDVYNNNVKHKFMYKCGAKLDTWNSRKTVVKTAFVQANLPLKEKEMKITNSMAELYKNFICEEEILSFKLIVVCKTNPCSVTVQMHKIKSYKKTFKNFTQCMLRLFPQWWMAHENDLRSKTV